MKKSLSCSSLNYHLDVCFQSLSFKLLLMPGMICTLCQVFHVETMEAAVKSVVSGFEGGPIQ